MGMSGMTSREGRMSRYKIVYEGEWVSIAPLINTRFVPLNPECEWCNRLSCAPIWMSIKTKRVRCKKCFTPQLAALRT